MTLRRTEWPGLLLLIIVLMSACSTAPVGPRIIVDDGLTAPVEDVDASITGQSPNYSFDDGNAADRAVGDSGQRPPPATTLSSQEHTQSKRAPKGTVIALLSQARYQQSTGHPERAAAVLERALRIDPKNARLWHELARIRLLQGKLSLAESLVAKSNALAQHDDALRDENSEIIDAVKAQRQIPD